MKWVITYDLSDDRLRERVADRLGTFGWRVQESVFECTFDTEALPEVVAVLERELGDAADANIRIYRICRDCLAVAVGIGSIRSIPDEHPCVVL
ncbi:MAG: CRISPR-associated endonuclease Cas2 [Thermoanaerobaculia bacterium]